MTDDANKPKPVKTYRLELWVSREMRPKERQIFIEGVGWGTVLDLLDQPEGSCMVKLRFQVDSLVQSLMALDPRIPTASVH